MAVLKTQGTELFVYDPVADEVIDAGCVTSINGASSPISQIEVTCLTADSRAYVAGLREPGTTSFTINFDPSNPNHLKFFDLYETGQVVKFYIGFSDGTDPVTSSGGTPTIPTTRTFLSFDGYITDIPFEFGLNAVVSTEVGVQISGDIQLSAKT